MHNFMQYFRKCLSALAEYDTNFMVVLSHELVHEISRNFIFSFTTKHSNTSKHSISKAVFPFFPIYFLFFLLNSFWFLIVRHKYSRCDSRTNPGNVVKLYNSFS